jgi:hypothetical protein
MQMFFSRQRIYNGQWGSAPFQSVYAPAAGLFASLPLMPEWYVLVGTALALGLLGFSWPPLFLFLAIGLTGLGISTGMAFKAASCAHFHGKRRPGNVRRLRMIVFALHLLQPISRLIGRARHGIGPWSSRDKRLRPVPRGRSLGFWSGRWQSTEARLERILAYFRLANIPATAGGDFDPWDITISGSLFGGVRTLAMVEDHGGEVQQFRMRAWPVIPNAVVVAVGAGLLLAAAAALGGAIVASALLVLASLVLAALAYIGCATAMAAWLKAFDACAAAEQEN